MYREVILVSLSAKVRIDRMTGGRDHAVRTEHGVVADVDVGIVRQRAVEIQVHVFSEVTVFSPEIGMERKLDIRAFPELRENLLAEFFTASQIRRFRRVQFRQFIQTVELLVHDLRITGNIQISAM